MLPPKSPNFASVGVLALIVLIRRFLSFTLELEINGRWPWLRRTSDEQAWAKTSMSPRAQSTGPLSPVPSRDA